MTRLLSVLLHHECAAWLMERAVLRSREARVARLRAEAKALHASLPDYACGCTVARLCQEHVRRGPSCDKWGGTR